MNIVSLFCMSGRMRQVSSLFTFLFCAAVVPHGVGAPGDENWDGRFGVPGAGEISAIAVSGDDLFVGGPFSVEAAGVSRANYIARWSGAGGWWPVGGTVTGAVNAITARNGRVYAGGLFTMIGNPQADCIAMWDGTNWSSLGAGITNEANVLPPKVNAMAWRGTDLIIGGGFTRAGGVSAGAVARWDGTNWFPLGVTGLSAGINAIAVLGNDIYVAGTFSSIGGVSANSIARWDGSAWSALGSGVTDGLQPGQVFALAVSGNNLYVGGYFRVAGGLPNFGFAKWNGSSWSQPGGVGSSGTVRAIAVQGTNLI